MTQVIKFIRSALDPKGSRTILSARRRIDLGSLADASSNKDLAKSPGIYVVTHPAYGCLYVGQTSKLLSRFKDHGKWFGKRNIKTKYQAHQQFFGFFDPKKVQVSYLKPVFPPYVHVGFTTDVFERILQLHLCPLFDELYPRKTKRSATRKLSINKFKQALQNRKRIQQPRRKRL